MTGARAVTLTSAEAETLADLAVDLAAEARRAPGADFHREHYRRRFLAGLAGISATTGERIAAAAQGIAQADQTAPTTGTDEVEAVARRILESDRLARGGD